MAVSEKIAGRRASLAQVGLETLVHRAPVPLGHAAADACLKGGLRLGALHEVFAQSGHETAATGFAAGLAARVAATKSVLWIRQDFSALEFGELSATGLLEFGLDPSRLFLLATAHGEDAVRAATDALSCASLGAVVIEIPGDAKILDMVTSRRLTLAAAQNGVAAILLRFAAKPQASTAETRWLVRAAPSPRRDDDWGHPAFKTELIRNRHGQTGQWIMEWDCDDGFFGQPWDGCAANRGAVVSAPSDRQAAAALETDSGNADTLRAAA